MILTSQYGSLVGLAVVLAGALSPWAAKADSVDITPTVTQMNGLYTYDYSITNNLADELSFITIDVPAGPDTIDTSSFVTPGAPGDFTLAYDSGLGQLDLIAGNLSFAGMSTISGFMFTSPLPAGPTTFTALDDSLNTAATGITFAPALVPEPGIPALIGALVGSGIWGLVRRRTARS